MQINTCNNAQLAGILSSLRSLTLYRIPMSKAGHICASANMQHHIKSSLSYISHWDSFKFLILFYLLIIFKLDWIHKAISIMVQEWIAKTIRERATGKGYTSFLGRSDKSKWHFHFWFKNVHWQQTALKQRWKIDAENFPQNIRLWLWTASIKTTSINVGHIHNAKELNTDSSGEQWFSKTFYIKANLAGIYQQTDRRAKKAFCQPLMKMNCQSLCNLQCLLAKSNF